MVSHTVLIAPGHFAGELDGARVAAAVGRGLQTVGDWELDLCPIAREGDPAQVRELLDALDFDARMKASHAVVVLEARLGHAILRGSAAFEIATRARQGGVPAYAITACNELDRFEARILDLQLVLEAQNERALVAAGRRLAKVI
jgi:glycerate kinase